ncbi:hypothetical protein RvY_08402 [Ramazzottius varieornatus]|uniref:Uncharacterized protein n=1 Tax=Ramazzottius varieornatus TaxID=947166 RepID=A0A1D1V5N5_RAMVA|nr:hypothetical protein RvY_08402 [Ramazzottius varieornatus]
MTCACNSSYCNDWTFQSLRRTFDGQAALVPWKGLFAANYMPYPAGQPDSNKPTTPFVPKTRATELTTRAPPSRRTLPVQPSELKYEQQYCYECAGVVDGTGRLMNSNSTKKAFDDKDVVFPAENKKCFSESKQSLSKFEGTGLCPANSVCGIELIEERVNSSKEGLLHKLTRKCVDRTVESGFNNACNKRKQIGPTLASMHCICEGAHYCNDWTLNSIKQRYYTETTTLDQANALNPGNSYPPYTGPLEGVPADKQKHMVTRTCDSPDFYTLSYGCTKTQPNKFTAENEMTCACWANYCNDFTFASLKDAFHRNGKVLWTSGQSPPIFVYTAKPGAKDPDDNGTYVTRPYVASDVGPRPSKTCAASSAFKASDMFSNHSSRWFWCLLRVQTYPRPSR